MTMAQAMRVTETLLIKDGFEALLRAVGYVNLPITPKPRSGRNSKTLENSFYSFKLAFYAVTLFHHCL